MVLVLNTRPMRPIIVALLLLMLSACNPFYVTQAGITQSEILLNRRDISEVLGDPATPPEIQRKLELVRAARDFTSRISLEPKGTFQSYSALDRDILAWIVLASKPDSFAFYTWWFPIVGSVPYKGYFSPEGAQRMALDLQDEGYETLVRGTEAFSTLGWFDDPVMTPMLKNQDHDIVTTVIHEVLHTTLWVPDHVAFNESLANFVGHQGAISFYQYRLAQCPSADQRCSAEEEQHLEAAQHALEQALDISRTLAQLVPQLKDLYQSQRSREEKLLEREAIFASHIDPLRKRIPGLKILKKANNAELMQLQLYYSKLDTFLTLWTLTQGDWSKLMDHLRLVSEQSRRLEVDPFDFIDQRLKAAVKVQPPAW